MFNNQWNKGTDQSEWPFWRRIPEASLLGEALTVWLFGGGPEDRGTDWDMGIPGQNGTWGFYLLIYGSASTIY